MYIVSMILLLVISIPIYLCLKSLFEYKHPQKVYMIIKDTFTRVIKRHKLTISEINLFGNRIIAVDRKINKLVLIHYKHGIAWRKCINLHDIISCRIATITHKVSGKIQKVNLKLTFRKGGIITFPFFDDEVDVKRDPSMRIKTALYWVGKIQYKKKTVQLANVN